MTYINWLMFCLFSVVTCQFPLLYLFTVVRCLVVNKVVYTNARVSHKGPALIHCSCFFQHSAACVTAIQPVRLAEQQYGIIEIWGSYCRLMCPNRMATFGAALPQLRRRLCTPIYLSLCLSVCKQNYSKYNAQDRSRWNKLA